MDELTPAQAEAALAEARRRRIDTLSHPGTWWLRLGVVVAAAAIGLSIDLTGPGLIPVLAVAGAALVIGLAVMLASGQPQRRRLNRLGIGVILERGALTPVERIVTVAVATVLTSLLYQLAYRLVLSPEPPLRYMWSAVLIAAGGVLGLPPLQRLALHRWSDYGRR